MAFTPSPQQAAVFDWTSNGRGSAIVEAVAGAGKTTTLIELLKLTTGAVAFMAYNKKIADEIKSKVAPLGFGKRVQVGTVHSFGFSALRRAFPDAQVEGRKLELLAERLAMQMDIRPFAMKAVSLAKQTGIGALVPAAQRSSWYTLVDTHDLADLLPEDGNVTMTDALRSACQLLKASNEAVNEWVDFDDMVYVPVQRGLRMWRNKWVLVDEAQDTNGTRRALAKMMLEPGGRLVAVGDPAQAIYGFTGADSDSLDLIRKEFNAVTLPLTITYRCPKAVVREAQRWVNHIVAADSAPEGSVETIDENTFWGTKENPGAFVGLNAEDAVLCRNTKPLISLAYGLLRRGIGCMVEGREIGVGLIKLTNKWKKARTIGTLRKRLEEWGEKEVAKALAKSQEGRAQAVADQVETLKEIMSQFADDDSVTKLHDAINKLFGDTPPGERPKVVTLSTIHKSKGREWMRVFWWGMNAYQPSPYARQEWQQGQERNLMYVAATRSQDKLIYVEVGA